MGSSLNYCCQKDNLPSKQEQTISEYKIFLQICNQIMELIQSIIQKTLNPYLETVFLLFDCLVQRFSKNSSFLISKLPIIRKLRVESQKFLEQISNESKSKELIDHTLNTSPINTLESLLVEHFGGNIIVAFYKNDEKYCKFDNILKKLSQIHMEIKEKENEIPKELFQNLNSNISGSFWLNSFEMKSTIPIKKFIDSFSKMIISCYDIKLQPHEVLTIQAELDINNDFLIGIDSWNNFYNKIWSKYAEREKFLNGAAIFQDKGVPLLKSKMELRFLKHEQPQEEYEIFAVSENGVSYPNNLRLLSIKKDLYSECIFAGKLPECEIPINENNKEEIQFQIHAKKAIGNKKKLENWFFFNDMGKKHNTIFIVNEVGFALNKGMVININGNSFKINDINPIPILYAYDDIFYVDSRPKGDNLKSEIDINEYFIDLTFFRNGPKQKGHRFKVENTDEFFKITIGSSKKSDIYIQEKYVTEDHCFICFDPKKKCWIIKDETAPKDKTFAFACGFEEYEVSRKLEIKDRYVARGQRLFDGMRLLFEDKFFEVRCV